MSIDIKLLLSVVSERAAEDDRWTEADKAVQEVLSILGSYEETVPTELVYEGIRDVYLFDQGDDDE